MDFVALDFETANRKPDSVCEVGLAIVEGGMVRENKSWLVRPHDNLFEPFHSRLHGIDAEKVENAPEFWEVWQEIQYYFHHTFVVAHNARFDIGVLRHVLALYHIPIPEFFYSCSLNISKRIWQNRKSYGLHALCEWLEIELNHHSAASDANACAHIVLRASDELDIFDFEDLMKEADLRLNHIRHGERIPKKKMKSKKEWKKRNSFYNS